MRSIGYVCMGSTTSYTVGTREIFIDGGEYMVMYVNHYVLLPDYMDWHGLDYIKWGESSIDESEKKKLTAYLVMEAL